VLRWLGWRMVGSLPDAPRFVIIAAPHTSNLDFIIGMSLVFAQSLDAKWIGKREIFRGPLGMFFRWLGGIPVDRSSPHGVVADAIAAFKARDRMILAVAPEGTRKAVERWKTGFHRIAAGAGVPIVCGFFDNARKLVGFGPAIMPGPDMDADIDRLRTWYASLAGPP
jgi:1-acyl-sn-glycerol-3-phosphate acyltransferase